MFLFGIDMSLSGNELCVNMKCFCLQMICFSLKAICFCLNMVCIYMYKMFSVVGSYVPYSSATTGRRGQFGILNVKSGAVAVVRF